jgi:hypothetical protein
MDHPLKPYLFGLAIDFLPTKLCQTGTKEGGVSCGYPLISMVTAVARGSSQSLYAVDLQRTVMKAGHCTGTLG